jgi:hypothetical protein
MLDGSSPLKNAAAMGASCHALEDASSGGLSLFGAPAPPDEPDVDPDAPGPPGPPGEAPLLCPGESAVAPPGLTLGVWDDPWLPGETKASA